MQTEWHPTLRLPVLVTEAGRSTAYTYDALGNKLSEVVTDLATGQTRSQSWAYNAQGLAASTTDARGGSWTIASTPRATAPASATRSAMKRSGSTTPQAA